jgi:membrane protein DedA with SNARE-associated domain
MINHLLAFLTATGAAGVFIGMLLESACLPLPSEVILPFAGILVSQGTMSFWGAVGWTVAGQVAGSVLAYYVGQFGGRPFLVRYGKYFLFREHELDLAERWFRRHGETMVFTARLLPGVRSFISLPAGIVKMPLWRFLGYTILGALPWTVFLVWAGLRVGQVWADPAWHPYFRLAEVAVGVLLVGLAGWYVLRRRKQPVQ